MQAQPAELVRHQRTGLRKVSQVMIDEVQSLPRANVGKPIGRLDSEAMARVTRGLALWLGIAWWQASRA